MKIYKIAKPLDPNAYSYEKNPARQKQHEEWSKMPIFPGDSTLVHQKQDKEQIKDSYYGVHLTPSKERAAAYSMLKGTKNDPPVVICLTRGGEEKADVDANIVRDDISTWIYEINKTLSGKNNYTLLMNALQNQSERFESMPQEEVDIHSALNIVNIPLEILDHIGDLSEVDAVNTWKQMTSGSIPEKILIRVADQFREMKPIFEDRVVSIEQLELINPTPDDASYAILNNGDEEEKEEMLEENEYNVIGDILYDSEGRKILDNESIEYGWWMKVEKVIYQSENKTGNNEFVYHGTTLNRAKMAYPDLIK